MEEHLLQMDRRAFSSIRASFAVLTSGFYIFHFHEETLEPPLRFEFSHFERGGARRSAQERVGTSGLFCGELVFETSVFFNYLSLNYFCKTPILDYFESELICL